MMIAPRNGMVIIDPATRRSMLIVGIELAVLDTYWQRRINDGDVVTVDAPKAVHVENATAAAVPTSRGTKKTAEGKP